MTPLLEVRHITKEYPGCRANDRVNLCIDMGEIHALLGENGAGKSTLMKIIYGVVQPDEGELLWRGMPVNIKGPAHARQLGIGMVFQHFSLFDTLSVLENILLSLPAHEARDRLRVLRQLDDMGKRYGMHLDPHRPVSTLSTGERQRVELIRALLNEPQLLILDEPTSVLTPQECEGLFASLRKLAADGCSILFISHKLQEVKDLCQRATILRGGCVVDELDPRETDIDTMAARMVGSGTATHATTRPGVQGEAAISVHHLTLPGFSSHEVGVRDVSFTAYKGEILGIAGVAGNGQACMLRALSGEQLSQSDDVRIGARGIGRLNPAQRRKLGMAVVPEDRLGRGAVPDMTLVENALLTAADQGLVKKGVIQHGALRDWTSQLCKLFKVKTAGIDAQARSLSGGNLQKFIIGREVLQQPAVLVASHPTWGVDIGSAVAIREALLTLRDQGCAVIILSEDLDELFEISDRMTALCHGQLAPIKARQDTSVEEVGRWMGGDFSDTPPAAESSAIAAATAAHSDLPQENRHAQA
ncbi:ABC transporter [Pokkaliibacter plantistimulans]|uniref:ABC transporter n=1 Tax=Pokkaliibacter plantistimulans TaxID=1635171 RepID=A0ABX5LTP1_9GAMM|nr:ABC transporter ATP-binding protein [Pokkaliibacter plantistimulans]PXF28970.1 ABC transporter [Pokkaliibacter plantistimulans]